MGKPRAFELVGLGLGILGIGMPYVWRDLSTFITYPLIAVGALLVLYGLWLQRREKESQAGEPITVGEDSVVMGRVSGSVGNRSVVVGATDERGNTILNTPMAVGHGAKAGHGSIAIGAGAGAGLEKKKRPLG